MTRTVRAALVALVLAPCTVARLGAQPGSPERQAAGDPVPKFAIDASPIALTGDTRPHQYLGVVGPRAAWLGTEVGDAELWVHPFKLASQFRLDFRIPDFVDPIRGSDVARTVVVRPEMTTIVYAHATFTVREHILAPLDDPGLLVLLDVESVRPLEIVASFRNVFQYAWPGAFGGQYVQWDPDMRAFLLSESLRRRNALIGSPWAASASEHPAHALPDAPSVFRIPVDPVRARREFVPIVIAAGTMPREALARVYRGMVENAETRYRERVRHADALRESTVSLRSPDTALDLALEWAKVNLDEQRVCNPDLGCGPVAGWAASGQSTRPGFGWFFGGDAAINSLAMSSVGLHAPVAEGLRFFAKYQRADGKITHEISQAAGQLPWFTDFPYTYYHADTTPYWIVAVWQHWLATGDRALVDELWPAIRKAWTWCVSTETDGDGLMENTGGGLGAIEVGAIGESIHEDIYLAAVWLEATLAMADLAEARGEVEVARAARALKEAGTRTLNERYWLEAAGHHAFGLLASGRTNDALTVWPATAAAFGLLEPDRADRTLAAIASHRLTADWGARMLATDHSLYDPLHYNMGAVWPFVTGFVAWGHYRYERPWAAFPLVDALARLTFDFARGRHPELLSGAFYRPLDTAVPHQFFATSMFVTPLMRGLVGWSADATRRTAHLAPQLPPTWPTLDVRRLPVGNSRVDVSFVQRAGRLEARLQAAGDPVDIDYEPPTPAGARDSRSAFGAPRAGNPGREPAARIRVHVTGEPTTVVTTWRGGYAVSPPEPSLTVGGVSEGVRVIDVTTAPDGSVAIELEAPAASAHRLTIVGNRPVSVDGASIESWAGSVGRLRTTLPPASAEKAATGVPQFSRRTIVLRER